MKTHQDHAWPKQLPYIIANEACERFSFYGMRNILTPFLMTVLLLSIPEHLRAGEAKDIFHSFVIGVYFFPLLGGYLADKWLGKYRTILYLSLIYCVGHLCLAVFEHNLHGFYAGLFLIALGAGGIKPLVSAFMGDQFTQSNKHLARKAFDWFYFTINVGSFLASLLMPLVLKFFGAAWAFGLPGLLMALATLFFWLGRHRYVHVPADPANPHSFLKVVKTALLTKRAGEFNLGFGLAAGGVLCAVVALSHMASLGIVAALCLALVCVMGFGGAGAALQLDRARISHPDDAVDGVRIVLRVLVLFALVTPFWSLFDQKASTWVLQANQMTRPDWFEPAMMQALNPALVMLLIPFNNFVLYPFLQKSGLQVTALRRMGAGIAFSGLAWIVAGTLQVWLDGGHVVSIVWQILPYALLTFGEVLVSATGLEFAYSQAPAAMKGTITAFWQLSVTVGNLWVLLANNSIRSEAVLSHVDQTGLSQTAFLMYFFAAFALIAAAIFAIAATRYQEVDNYRSS